MNIASDDEKAKPAGTTLSPLLPHATASYTIVVGDRPMSKRFGIADDKPIKLGSDAPLVSGQALRKTLTGSATEMISQLSQELNGLGPANALICAPPPAGKKAWRVMTNDNVGDRTDVISRSKRYFVPEAGPALIGLDFDIRDYPDFVRERLQQVGNLSAALANACPELAAAASVSRASMSAGVRVRGTANETDRKAGQHRFYIADDGTRVEPFVANLRDHLMLTGWIWGTVTKSGSILFRTLFDFVASSDPSRLWYEGKPVLEDERLEFLPERRTPTPIPGTVLDTSQLGPLTEEQRDRLREKQLEIRKSLENDAASTRTSWAKVMRARVPSGTAPFGLSRAFDNAADDRILQGSFPIQLDDGRVVTARQILADPKAFNRLTCADPVEPDYNGGRNIGVIFTDGGRARIESQAHGGIRYSLALAVEDFFEPIVEDATSSTAASELNPRDIFRDGEVGARVLQIPAGALPPVIDRWAVDVSERIGAPPAFAAVAALATIAGAIGSKLKIQPKQFDSGWLEPAFLWFGIVEAPGGRKSPIIAQATAPLSKLDAQKARDGGEAWSQWSERKRQAKRGQPWTEPEPKIRRHVVDNFTVEALTGVLADNPSGVLVSVDELTGLIGSFDAYKANRGGDRPMMLRLFDGRENRIDRVGRKNTFVECWGAAMIGGIQPKKITELASDLDADGLLQRFLPVWGDGERRQGVDRAPDHTAVATYDAAVRQLAGAEFPFPAPVTLSSEAHVVWRQVIERLSALSGLPGLSEAWAGHMGKWPGFSARLLLICHVLAHLDNLAEVDRHAVSEGTAMQASKLVDWLLANSIRFYIECIGAGEAGDDAKWLAGFILSSRLQGQLTRREIGRARREMRDDPGRIGRAMRFLENSEWCVADNSERTDKFGPSRWTICPAVHDGRFADHADRETKRRTVERARVAAAVAERRRLLQEQTDG